MARAEAGVCVSPCGDVHVLTTDQLKPFLIHPDVEVRNFVASCFSESWCSA